MLACAGGGRAPASAAAIAVARWGFGTGRNERIRWHYPIVMRAVRWARRWDLRLILALGAMLMLLFLTLFGPRLAPHEPIYFVIEHGHADRPYEPGLVYPAGSDVLGRDLLSLVLAGAPATLGIVLLAGIARVGAGVLVALLSTWWRPARVLTESVAELVAAAPATLVALILLKALVKTDTNVLVFIGALLLIGWAGPYRVVRAEADRLAGAPFTLGARALGIGRWRLFWRHHLPHLAPVILVNTTQQVVAALVLVAELGVLGVFVGPVRLLNVEESLANFRVGPPMSAMVPDIPEWGAMLATSRTIEALWLTRWVIFVPGIAFAVTAILVGSIGYLLARRYARRDIMADGRGVAIVALAAAALFVVSGLVPERFAQAREWANAARGAVRSIDSSSSGPSAAGLRTFEVASGQTTIVRAGPTTVSIAGASVAEGNASAAPGSPVVRAVVADRLGGGTVEAPLVFAGRGIVPSDFSTQPPLYRPDTTRLYGYGSTCVAGRPCLGALIQSYPDDYAAVDVRGKVVLLVRFMGVATSGLHAEGPHVARSIADAIERGAAAVVLVDPQLGVYAETNDPYRQLERDLPATTTAGVPVVVVNVAAAERLTAPLGLELGQLTGYDREGMRWERSPARELDVTARVAVPLKPEASDFRSSVTEVVGVPGDAARVVIWAPRDPKTGRLTKAQSDLLEGVASLAGSRLAPFIFVDFDPRADSRAVRDALKGRKVTLVLLVSDLEGEVIEFVTANGDLIPAIDYYAREAGARAEVTRRTAPLQALIAPFPGVRTIGIRATGAAGAAREDAAAIIGYLAGRLVLGAPELPR